MKHITVVGDRVGVSYQALRAKLLFWPVNTARLKLLFVEILFAVRTITFRSIFLFKMHNGHALPHNFSLQQMAKFLPVFLCQNVLPNRAISFAASTKEVKIALPSVKIVLRFRKVHENQIA